MWQEKINALVLQYGIYTGGAIGVGLLWVMMRFLQFRFSASYRRSVFREQAEHALARAEALKYEAAVGNLVDEYECEYLSK